MLVLICPNEADPFDGQSKAVRSDGIRAKYYYRVTWLHGNFFAVLNITDSYGSNVQLANALPYGPVERMAMTGDINALKN